MTYSARIKAFRESRKLTHQQFADAVGVSRGSVQQWENGATAPKRVNQPAVARFMGITASELMGEGEPTQSCVIPPEYKPNHPLAGESIAQGAININVNRQAPQSAHDVATALLSLMARVEPGHRDAVASLLSSLARNPADPLLTEMLVKILDPAAFIQPEQRTG